MQMNVADEITASLRDAIGRGGFPAPDHITLIRPDDDARGDYASNVGFLLAKTARRKPLEIAAEIAKHFSGPAAAEAAAPGFINFTITRERLLRNLEEMEDPRWGRNESGSGQKINLEYVSANPTGPLHVGHGRGAVIGDVIARLLTTSGYEVTREYYVNDVGRQIEVLGESVLHLARGDDAYPLTYTGESLERIAREYAGPRDDVNAAADFAAERLLKEIFADLARLNITFDSIVTESSLHPAIPKLIETYRERGLLYDASEAQQTEQIRRADSKAAIHRDKMEGGTFLRTTQFGDETDRVILRADGRPTYFTADIVYHAEKFRRGCDRAINIWGADHGGHVRRMQAALTAAGAPAEKLDVVLCQIVRLIRGGLEVKMSKRSGNLVSLAELIDEVGADAARFFYLMRGPNSQLDFDLDLAVKSSADNPVFYCQYAHARTCSLLEKGGAFRAPGLDELSHPIEIEIMRALARLPEAVRGIATRFEAHQLPERAIELAGILHKYQTAGKVDGAIRIIDSPARLYLIDRVRRALRFLFELMGVSAPGQM